MRAWLIVLSSAVVAVAVTAALVRPELAMTPHAAILPQLMPLAPTLAVTLLAVYALCAILITSGDLIFESMRLRRYLDRSVAHWEPAQPHWTAVFEESALHRMIPRPAAVQPRPAPGDGTVVLQAGFQPREARREVARLFYIGAARTHFFSALIVLAAGVVLGAVQQHGPPVLPGPIPTLAAALAVAGLALLAVLGRIAVDVAAEPLVEAIARLPAEPVEAGLLRRTIELLETAGTARPTRSAAPAASAQPLPSALVGVLEQGQESQRALLDAIDRLTTTTDGLATTTRSSIEALEAAFRSAEPHQPATPPAASVDANVVMELRDAMTALTAAVQGSRSVPAAAATSLAPIPASPERDPDLAQELRKLLQEIETSA